MNDVKQILAAEAQEIAVWMEGRLTAAGPLAPPPEAIMQQLGVLCANCMATLPLIGPLVAGVFVGQTMFEARVRYGRALAALGDRESGAR